MVVGDVLILGLGSSGAAAARYCAALPDGEVTSVTAVDGADSAALRSVADELASLGVTVALGVSEVPGTYDLCIASPGIPPHASLMKSAVEAATEVVSEIEFAYRRSGCPWVAITGTNGKTTTTALVEHLLTAGGMNARAVGNIGTPAIEAAAECDDAQVLVAEVSSFQLALTKHFRPRCAVLLNITPDHIDWHGSLEAYAEDKSRAFANLGADDVAVIDVDDPGSAARVGAVEAAGVPVVRVSRDTRHVPGATVADGVMRLETHAGSIELVSVDELLIRGAHNVSNALAASAAAHAMGVAPADIIAGLRTFAPIEHRLEPAGEVGGIEWFNDSKATNPDAVAKAIAAFPDRRIVLLLGGRNKGNDFAELAALTHGVARAVVLFGEAAPEIAVAFDDGPVPSVRAATLADAVEAARGLAEPGDAVVLSPACASFDEFANYEQRGRVFKQLVARMGEDAR